MRYVHDLGMEAKVVAETLSGLHKNETTHRWVAGLRACTLVVNSVTQMLELIREVRRCIVHPQLLSVVMSTFWNQSVILIGFLTFGSCRTMRVTCQGI